jgi:hypothetical protein
MQKMNTQWDGLQRRAKMLEARLEVRAFSQHRAARRRAPLLISFPPLLCPRLWCPLPE